MTDADVDRIAMRIVEILEARKEERRVEAARERTPFWESVAQLAALRDRVPMERRSMSAVRNMPCDLCEEPLNPRSELPRGPAPSRRTAPQERHEEALMAGWAFSEGEWHRRAGRLHIVVWEQGGGWPWQVTIGDTAIAIGRTREECLSLAVAKRAAEEAAHKFASDVLADVGTRPSTCDLCEDGVERTGSLHRMQHEHNGSTYYIGCSDAEGE